MPFSDAPRTDAGPKRERESSFEFLDRSSRPEIGRVRDLIGSAIESYPCTEADELIARIKSRDEIAFRSATFELLLHEGLRRLGYGLTPHPTLPGSNKKPDFLVSAPGGESFYLEAVLAGVRDETDPAGEAIKATTLDELAHSPHPRFMVDVDSEGSPRTQPSARALIREVHRWLDSLDREAVTRLWAESRWDDLPSLEWRHEEWQLKLRPIALREGRVAPRLIGAQAGEARMIDQWTPLRDAVRSKGGRYGDMDRPFVVAVNAESFHLDAIDEEQALFGQEEWVEYMGRPDIPGRLRRQPNGAWVGPRGLQGRRVSAAWFFTDLTPYTVASRRNTLYVNPGATHMVPASLLRFPHVRVVENRLERTDGLSFRDAFGLQEEWPE